MDSPMKVEMLCAVLGLIGTDDREDTKTIRNPRPVVLSPTFPAKFPGLALYTEWMGVGMCALTAEIQPDAPGAPVIHTDERIKFDFTKGLHYRLVLDLDEVVFPVPGPYAVTFCRPGTEECYGLRRFWVLPGDESMLKNKMVDHK
ncbi:MAG: hypothetical protein L6R43_04580 [Planctomycetes bacterium]|nr:hypothetical protein [Planctomycetota bacterium]